MYVDIEKSFLKKTMKRTTVLFMAVAAVMAFAACNSNTSDNGKQHFTIEGTLTNAANKTLYIEEMTPDNGAHFVDSIFCDKNGHFKYQGEMDYQTFFNLHSTEYNYIVLLPNNGEKMTVSGDYNTLSTNYLINGSPESQLLWQIQSYITDANIVIAGLAEKDKQNRSSLGEAEYAKAKEATDSAFVEERILVQKMFLNFIDENMGSLSTLYAVDAPFNHTMRVFYVESDFEVFEMVLDGLKESNPENPHTLYYQTRVERARSARALAAQQQQEGQEIIIE